jgi:hypothetical protein
MEASFERYFTNKLVQRGIHTRHGHMVEIMEAAVFTSRQLMKLAGSMSRKACTHCSEGIDRDSDASVNTCSFDQSTTERPHLLLLQDLVDPGERDAEEFLGRTVDCRRQRVLAS